MNEPTQNKLQQATSAYHQLKQTLQSVILSTLDAQGNPYTSYAPFVMDEASNIYLLGSELAEHTQHLLKTPKASVLFIEDEAKAAQIFGRCRLTFQCHSTEIQRTETLWTEIIDKLQKRLGETVTMIASLPDFHLFKLTPQTGRFVLGFGAIYNINPDNLDQLVPARIR